MDRRLDGLYDPDRDHSSCGVGFITRKDGRRTHETLRLAHDALCSVPHRGGISAEGIGDGGGVSIDLSPEFFSQLTGRSLEPGAFGVANFFWPVDPDGAAVAESLIEKVLARHGLTVLLRRDVPTEPSALSLRSHARQLPIRQWVYEVDVPDAEAVSYAAMLAIEARAFTDDALTGLYPLSMSTRVQVLKGRLSSPELMAYFTDLLDPAHVVHTVFFHTRFSTNTEPHPSMAQPFRLMAHNGELNTDRKNRLAETATAAAHGRAIVRPPGQSDSSRLDQTLHRRVVEEGADLLTAIVSMMPPAWENDTTLARPVRAMLEYFSLAEEKNDGPAAVVFGDGTMVGARLDRLGLRPLRTVETAEYVAASSEAGQFGFDPATELRRGRIEAGGMIVFDHATGRLLHTADVLAELAARRDYTSLLEQARTGLADLPAARVSEEGPSDFDADAELVASYVDAESLKLMTDPMLANGVEKVSAMGYGHAVNAFASAEADVARLFSQRFAQVTNPPLDSIREADGMSLRVALGPKPGSVSDAAHQIVVDAPVIDADALERLHRQDLLATVRVDALYSPDHADADANAAALIEAVERVCREVADVAQRGGIVVLTDRGMGPDQAAIPLPLVVGAVNHHLVEIGLRLRVSLVVDSGQLPSAHHVATALALGAAAVHPRGVRVRARQLYGDDADAAFGRFVTAAHKSLMKTMGRVGLCTVESYSGGEFLEPDFLDTDDPVLARWFPTMHAPVGGVGLSQIAAVATSWHRRAVTGEEPPRLGLFKERREGAGHSFGLTSVREYTALVGDRDGLTAVQGPRAESLRLLTLQRLDDAFGLDADAYQVDGFAPLDRAQIDAAGVTSSHRLFVASMMEERRQRPAALRDVLATPVDLAVVSTTADFVTGLGSIAVSGNRIVSIRGLACRTTADGVHVLRLTGPHAADAMRLDALGRALEELFGDAVEVGWRGRHELHVRAAGAADRAISSWRTAPASIRLDEVEPASDVIARFASGAMSHGALTATAHEAVAHGTNMVGGLSNSGEGGEHRSRYGTVRASRIKQLASGRFGVWAGYLADPMLQEIEIKIGQGAKPGEGGQLPAAKVTVEIAAARAGTPGVELVSPPPHHDTYSIEDLAQLIHDAKAARVRVVVKLVSSEGIGTIAVGVAKAGADVINIAGATGGTGAASVTSLKFAGRAPELGIAEVHQALSANGLRDDVVLRVSGAHQLGRDVLVSALLGGDSFEFGTASLMMLGCVMAKNCNVACPAGLTTNPEVFEGDPRALAQYLLCLGHEVRELLAELGLPSLAAARGRADLLHLVNSPAVTSRLDVGRLLAPADLLAVSDPVRVEARFDVDEAVIAAVRAELVESGSDRIEVDVETPLGNRDKSVGGRLAIDVERLLNHELDDIDSMPAVRIDDRGHRFLEPGTVTVRTRGVAGQSYGVWAGAGLRLEHVGVANDGVGKGLCGGCLVLRSPGGCADGEDVLIGNFALFGATGGRLFVQGAAGDRFAVRNSGATAVVEGVGDFAAEYMTGGTVLNLGGFGSGLGNGMSGGFVYQYDPQDRLAERASRDSVAILAVGDTDASDVHEDAIVTLLRWHHEATGSALAGDLLDRWDRVRDDFRVASPLALTRHQDADHLLRSHSRRELVEELAATLVAHQVRSFKVEYRDGSPPLAGRAPGPDDDEDAAALLNRLLVLSHARRLAESRLKDAGQPELEHAARNLVLTEDHFLITSLMGHARSALEVHGDEDVAALVAAARLRDYQDALRRRNVLCVDGVGTYGWMMRRAASDHARLSRLPGFERLFAAQGITELAATAGTRP